MPGFDHTKLPDRYGGRDFRLTNIHGDSCPRYHCVVVDPCRALQNR
ncbi:MAG: hypothetical protein R3C19_19405 [Planctomycetaceae bacterium]